MMMNAANTGFFAMLSFFKFRLTNNYVVYMCTYAAIDINTELHVTSTLYLDES
jgi:hypothetical protein